MSETRVAASRELDELYRSHAPEVYRYVYAVLGNSADAEDVTQTTFVNALRALERGEHPRKPTNWLITIAHNLIRQRFRQQQTRPREVELDRDVPVAEAADDGPSIDDLVRALQRIPAAQREALVLREMEGRSYKEITAILGVSQAALETRIFRARRSLAEELENLGTCDRAELALSQRADGRLGRKERKRLVAHLEECPSCSRVVVLGMRRRRAFKSLALIPLPLSLTLFKGAPSASAAVGLPTLGVGAAAGTAAVGTVGVSAKIAIGLAAVAVASGAGYEGVNAVREPATPKRPAKAAPAAIVPAAQLPAIAPAEEPAAAKVKAAKVKTKPIAKKVVRVKPARTQAPPRGRSASAPGRTKTAPGLTKSAPVRIKAGPGRMKTTSNPKAAVQANGPSRLGPATAPTRGKSAKAPGRVKALDGPPKAKKPARADRGIASPQQS